MLEGGEKSGHAVLAGNTRRVVLRLALPRFSICFRWHSLETERPPSSQSQEAAREQSLPFCVCGNH